MHNQMNIRSDGKRYQQPRSNSISGQEFHRIVGENQLSATQQRLKQQANYHLNQSPYVDANHYYNQRLYNLTQYKQNLLTDRSSSPASMASQRPTDLYIPKRGSSIKYSYDTRQLQPGRNHMHTSLECLNTIYSDYSQNLSQKHHHQQQHQQQLQLHQLSATQLRQYNQQFQHPKGLQPNQHYAASYVSASLLPDPVISHSNEQDLAAAAMGAPPNQQYSYTSISSATPDINNHDSSTHSSGLEKSSNYQSHNLLTRTQQISQSPLRRSRLVRGQGAVANILNHITSNSNPIRPGHSSLSLTSSTYLMEDKLQTEIKQLQSELKSEKEKNEALSSQLNINSNLMAAFEQSLNTLNNRLRQLTTLNEKKDKEIDELRMKLEMSDDPYNLSMDKLTTGHYGTSEKLTSPISGEHHQDQIKRDQSTQHLIISPNISSSHDNTTSGSPSPIHTNNNGKFSSEEQNLTNKSDDGGENLMKVVEDLKRQLLEKDRLLTDTRLEALSAAHQLEQFESRLNGEQSLLTNDDDLDEGVMVSNHSPSDSDAHFSDQHSHLTNKYGLPNQQQTSQLGQRLKTTLNQANRQAHQQQHNQQTHQRMSSSQDDMIMFTPIRTGHCTSDNSRITTDNSVNDTNKLDYNSLNQVNNLQSQSLPQDNQSDRSSSDYHMDDKSPGDTIQSECNSTKAYANGDGTTSEPTIGMHKTNSEAMTKMLDNLLVNT